MLYKRAANAWDRISIRGGTVALLNDDCRNLLRALPDNSVALVVTSPPYCMGKEYEPGNTMADFVKAHDEILPEIVRVLRPGGSLCWQVGYHAQNSAIIPLDYLVYDAIRKLDTKLIMRNRIIWHFGHGRHCERRFSGRHETLLWFTKGEGHLFNLDSIRVPQKYPGKRATKGPRQGEFSGNPLGKNPSDVWDIPNVKANHVEKLDHPCQFPVALVRRLVLALTKPGDLVLDPFCGVGSSGVAALLEKRRFLGAELDEGYARIAEQRLQETLHGVVRVRPDMDVHVPDQNRSVVKRPEHFWPQIQREACS